MHCGYMNVIISENIVQFSVVNTTYHIQLSLCADRKNEKLGGWPGNNDRFLSLFTLLGFQCIRPHESSLNSYTRTLNKCLKVAFL